MLLSTDLEQILTPKELVKIAKEIASKWKGVGLELGLEPEDIDIIAVDNPTFACSTLMIVIGPECHYSCCALLQLCTPSYYNAQKWNSV